MKRMLSFVMLMMLAIKCVSGLNSAFAGDVSGKTDAADMLAGNAASITVKR